MTQSQTLQINADFPKPLQCLFTPKRYKVLYGGRGAGRSWGVARALLLQGAKSPRRVLCAREFQHSIKDSVHKLLCDQIELLGLGSVYQIQQAQIRTVEGYFPGGAFSEFNFEGIRLNTTKIKSYEGIDDCWVEEAESVSENSWDILIPTIRKPGSRIIITFNPRLEDDATYKRFIASPPPPEMADIVHTTWRDNPWFTDEMRAEMEHLKATNYDKYLHVWEGQCQQLLDGVIFADELRETYSQGRVLPVPYDRGLPVNVYMDLGRADFTAIWFVQQAGFEFHVIDFYMNNLKHIDHYLQVMQDRGYVYETIWLPHDAKAKSLGTHMSIEEQVRSNRSWNVRIVPKLSITDRINAARSVFPQCYFDSKRCAEGLKYLKLYRYEVDEHGKYSQNPSHDDSDPADAFCYFATVAKKFKRKSYGGMMLQKAKESLTDFWETVEQYPNAGPDRGPNAWMG